MQWHFSNNSFSHLISLVKVWGSKQRTVEKNFPPPSKIQKELLKNHKYFFAGVKGKLVVDLTLAPDMTVNLNTLSPPPHKTFLLQSSV